MDSNQEAFKKLKECCVPLLGHSSLGPASIPQVSELLAQLIRTLREVTERQPLTVSLISYVFFPVSTILRRNAPSAIPDQVLEKIFTVLALLCERWWWDMDVKAWEQIYMFCELVLAGFDAKGKGRERADETREAALRCLWTLVRPRNPDEDPLGVQGLFVRSVPIFAKFQAHTRTPSFVPVMGQTVDSLLACAESRHPPLQKASLELLQVVIKDYLSDGFIPSILPGVVSSMCKVALAVGLHKTWANGDIVAASLSVIQEVVIRAIGNNICIEEGAVKDVQDLEDLVEIGSGVKERPREDKFSTVRTPAWLRGTASQLHIALNSLNSLVKHPSSTALHSLSSFAVAILSATSLTLPQSQPLLLTILLSLSSSEFDSVASQAFLCMTELLNSTSQFILLPVLLQISKDYLTALPRLLPTHSDTKVEHAAKVVEAICRLATAQEAQQTRSGLAVSAGIAKLLGASGGIEKWGWSLLSVLEISTPPITTISANAARLMLENDTEGVDFMPFPPVNLLLLTSQSAQSALERMFRALGSAAGDSCLYSAQWFFNIGRGDVSARAVAALWCGSRLLEGVGHVSLEHPVDSYTFRQGGSRRAIEKFARGIAKDLSDMWDEEPEFDSVPMQDGVQDDDEPVVVEHLSGLISVRGPLELSRHLNVNSQAQRTPVKQPELQKALALHAIAISSGILQAKFTPLLLDTLYPILHSLVAKSPHLSSTSLSTLHYITHATSHASPANLLLSNFDYALDAVSRHLSRRWLDVDAAAVLVVLVRLVGRDVVRKAGDVVDECFDRLDDFHGYEVLVDGLIAVLAEVVDVIGSDEANRLGSQSMPPVGSASPSDVVDPVDSVLHWLAHRADQQEEEEQTDFGPVPQEAWGKSHDDDEATEQAPDPTDETPATPTQALIQQIVSRSLFFLTHGSPTVRARILTLLARAVPVLPPSALLPSVHHAWPYVLNRFGDQESFVLSAAATLVESLATHVGDFMYRRIWDDIWPRFRVMLASLDTADAKSALARRGQRTVGTESSYTHSHRLYKAILKTMTATATSVQSHDNATWEVIVAFRRFLHKDAHDELQMYARDLYKALARNNEDAVWLALSATMGEVEVCSFLHEQKWDIRANVIAILGSEWRSQRHV